MGASMTDEALFKGEGASLKVKAGNCAVDDFNGLEPRLHQIFHSNCSNLDPCKVIAKAKHNFRKVCIKP